jgi:hypothetical protein
MAAVVAIMYLFMGLFGLTCFALLVYISFFTSHQWIPALYVTWFIFTREDAENGGCNITLLRKCWLYKYFMNYFPIKLIKTHDLDPEKTYLVVYHPHGIMSYGAVASFGGDHLGFKKVFPGLRPRLLTLEVQFFMPGFREIALCSGAASASIQSVLRQEGTAAVLVVGGAVESLFCGDQEKVTLFLKKRVGFVKLALQHGRDLVPAFGFGENEIFHQIPNQDGSKVKRFQEWLQTKLTFTLPLFFGRGVLQYTYGLISFRRPITVVVGSPVQVGKIDNPTFEDIMECHGKYVKALQRLYDEYNPVYGDKDIKLVIS